MSIYHYEVVAAEDGMLARCLELGVEATGPTRDEAIENLRVAVSETLSANEGIAPPEAPEVAFVLIERDEPPSEPSGPGDARRSFTSPSSPR